MPHKDPEAAAAYQREYARKHSSRKTAAAAKWNREHPERRRDIKIRAKFGIGAAEYDALLAAQGGVCAICRRPETVKHNQKTVSMLAVDHDHLTNRVRGLLCFNCNVGLGHLECHLDAAQDYLRVR